MYHYMLSLNMALFLILDFNIYFKLFSAIFEYFQPNKKYFYQKEKIYKYKGW